MNPLEVGGFTFNWGSKTYLMGILNLTPDSFSGDGLLAQEPGEIDAAMAQARQFAAAGADILDIGGESTRPGAQPIPAEVELERILPLIRAVSTELDVLISVDTYKSRVADAALQAGAHIVNDVWGLHADPELADVIAYHGAPVILMHNRSSWAHADIKERLGGRYVGIPYNNLIQDICQDLMESVALARQAGIPDDHIILDPGIGFGKTVEQNLELVNKLDEVHALGFPVLSGPSRKSFIGYTLNLPPDQRLEGTCAAAVVSIVRGADILRLHDVAFMSRVIRMTDAITRK
jgi:dihydropteroate synthase